MIRQLANGSLSAEQNALLRGIRANDETNASTDHEIINSILQENSTLHEQLAAKCSQLDQLTATCTKLEEDLNEKEILRLHEKEELEAQIQSLQDRQQAHTMAQSTNSGRYETYHGQEAETTTATNRSCFARIFRCC